MYLRQGAAALILSAAVLNAGVAECWEHHDPSFHYKIELPAGWENIPAPVIEEMRASILQEIGAEAPPYAGGFQSPSENWFVPPYILLQHHRGQLLLEELATGFTKIFGSGGDFPEEIQKAERSGALRNLSFGTPFVDQERRVVLITLDAELRDRPAKALMMMAPGRVGMVQVSLYVPPGELEAYSAVFDSMVDSFSFDPGFEYTGTKTVRWEPVIAAAIVGALGSLLWPISRSFKRRRSKASESKA